MVSVTNKPIMLNVFMLSDAILSVVVLNVVAPKFCHHFSNPYVDESKNMSLPDRLCRCLCGDLFTHTLQNLLGIQFKWNFPFLFLCMYPRWSPVQMPFYRRIYAKASNCLVMMQFNWKFCWEIQKYESAWSAL
jgi:hypothetical protein